MRLVRKFGTIISWRGPRFYVLFVLVCVVSAFNFPSRSNMKKTIYKFYVSGSKFLLFQMSWRYGFCTPPPPPFSTEIEYLTITKNNCKNGCSLCRSLRHLPNSSFCSYVHTEKYLVFVNNRFFVILRGGSRILQMAGSRQLQMCVWGGGGRQLIIWQAFSRKLRPLLPS